MSEIRHVENGWQRVGADLCGQGSAAHDLPPDLGGLGLDTRELGELGLDTRDLGELGLDTRDLGKLGLVGLDTCELGELGASPARPALGFRRERCKLGELGLDTRYLGAPGIIRRVRS